MLTFSSAEPMDLMYFLCLDPWKRGEESNDTGISCTDDQKVYTVLCYTMDSAPS